MYRCCRQLVRLYGSSTSTSTLHRRSLLQSQYDKIKSQFPNHVVLFQVGDFYEIMGNDAVEVSLKTSLRIAKKNTMSLVGFPVRSLNEWQRTLVQAGFQLAVCNQMETKDTSCGRLIDREVVQLVTPGTLTEPLDNEANYLMSIAAGPGLTSFGLAWLDLSTSHFEVASTNSIGEHIERVAPVEIIVSDDIHTDILSKSAIMPTASLLTKCLITPIKRVWFDSRPLNSVLLQRLDTHCYSLLEKKAVFALLHYIHHTNRAATPQIQAPPTQYRHTTHMSIDMNTRRALELTCSLHGDTSKKATLLGCINMTVTPPGGRLMKRILSSPLNDVDSINRRLDVVEHFHDNPDQVEMIRTKLRTGTGDLERTLQKIIGGSGGLNDLVSLQTSLECTREIVDYISSCCEEGTERILGNPIFNGLNEDNSNLVNTLKEAIHQGSDGLYSIREGYCKDIDGLSSELIHNDHLMNELTDRLIALTGVNRLSIVNHKTYYRVLETTKSKSTIIDNYSKDNDHHGLISHSELQRLNTAYQSLETRYSDSINKAFRSLCDKVSLCSSEVYNTAQGLAALDVFTSLAQLATERVKKTIFLHSVQNARILKGKILVMGFCKPVVNESNDFHIVKGFHPVLSNLQSTTFRGNNCHMERDKLWIITGPNMGGKSTFLRQNALIAILAQIGSFVPAESARIGVVDRLFARVGASDNLANQQSTFHVEMSETAHILSNATPNSFLILDEIGRGTSPSEGAAIAQSILEYIHNDIGCRTLLATHFHELSSLSDTHPRAGCYHVSATMDGESLLFDYRVKKGYTSSSFGVEVASLVGLPMKVIKRSLEILHHPTAPGTETETISSSQVDQPQQSLHGYVFRRLKNLIS